MAEVERIDIVVSADDNASGVLNSVRGSLNNLYRGLNQINSGLRQYNSAMAGVNRMMINIVKDAGAAIYDFTSDSINNFTELSEQHAKTLGAMANNYDKTIESQEKFFEHSEKLRQQAIDIAKYGTVIDGVQSGGSLVNATEVSAAQTALVKAGVDGESILNTDVLSTIIQFAVANQLETDDAVKFAVSLGSQFGYDYENWGEMLDKISHTADLAPIEVKDVVQSMKYAGGISSGLDRPMEETLAEIALLGNFGLAGSQAGSGIQALLTRILTGDTTVITQAQAAVAPPRALEAFYDFSNYAKSGGTAITYDDILNETFTETDITGQLRPMEEIVDTLGTVMADLNDEEQAWFAKKLFGLYQMKAAYGLINGDESQANLSELIKEIELNSDGTNANKLNELIYSQSGQIQTTKNLIEGIKTELGQMLEPTTTAILGEFQSFLKDPGNYNINWDRIKEALDESCNDIEEAYGTAIADAVRNLGTLTINLGQVVEQIAPEFLEGMVDVFNSILRGDIFGEDGIGANWSEMITNMHEALGELPPELQELGEKVVDVIDMFGKLAALNIATTIAQLITSVLQIALMTINAASVIVNGSTITGGGAGGAGGSGGGGTNTIGSNIAGVAGMAGGVYLASQIDDEVGEIASGMAEHLGADEETADKIGTAAKYGTDVAGGLGGAAAAKGAWGWLTAAGAEIGVLGFDGWALSSLAEAGMLEVGLDGAVGLTAAGGASLSAATIGGPLAAIALWKIYHDNKEMVQNQEQTGEIVRNGGHVGFDNNGNLIKDDDGNVLDMEQVKQDILASRAARTDIYAYMNGIEEFYMPAAPKKDIWNGWGLWGGYKKDYADWEEQIAQINANIDAEREQFYKVQENYYVANGGEMLTWEDYRNNREEYDNQYSEIVTTSITEATASIDALNETIASLGVGMLEGTNIPDWASVIPGFYALSEKGQESAIQNYINNELNITPSFSMEAPQIQVNVTVDESGRVLSQSQQILNPMFNTTMNTWYQRVASQNGASPK